MTLDPPFGLLVPENTTHFLTLREASIDGCIFANYSVITAPEQQLFLTLLSNYSVTVDGES